MNRTIRDQRGATLIVALILLVLVTMFALMGIGMLIILANYINLLPGGTSNTYLLIGLAGIAGGFGMTLNFR